jgi:hypothetical protein
MRSQHTRGVPVRAPFASSSTWAEQGTGRYLDSPLPEQFLTSNAAWYCWAALLVAAPAAAQELEPRALQNTPVGGNLLSVATGYSQGNLLIEPSVPIENAAADVFTLTPALFRAIDFFGMSGKVGVAVPMATGEWSGTVQGIDSSVTRTGFSDPRVIMSVNFLGAPALGRAAMRTYRPKTVAGLQLSVQVPLGQYSSERLVNLGLNRWSFQPRLGVARTVSARVIVEGYLAATFYTANTDNFGGTELTQTPFLEAQLHGIYNFPKPGLWLAASIGYGRGAQIAIDGVKEQSLENVRASAVLRVPLARQHGLKLVYINGLTTRLGADYDTFQVAWQYGFGGRP